MVSPYFTLLFSRKEITKFSELALVSVHFNCLIGCIVIMRGYWLWNTANTTADIYLLVENRNKNTKTKFKVCSNFFISHMAALRPTLGHSQRGTLTHYFKYDPKVTGSFVMRLSPQPESSASVEFEPDTFQILVLLF